MPDLREDWRKTQLHLGNIRGLLPSPAREALEELEGFGEINVCPPRFWRELLLAARIMGLRDHPANYDGCRSRPMQYSISE